jgi:hypothetical protein
MRAVRCDDCRRDRLAYCSHSRVLVVFIDGAPMSVISESEERARLTADVVSIKLRGRPFNRRRGVAA